MNVDDVGSRPGWCDVGHDPNCGNALWLINDKWEFFVQPVKGGIQHATWDKFIKGNLISAGRYDVRQHYATMSTSYDDKRFDLIRKSYTVSKIEKILDQAFNNPEIFIY